MAETTFTVAVHDCRPVTDGAPVRQYLACIPDDAVARHYICAKKIHVKATLEADTPDDYTWIYVDVKAPLRGLPRGPGLLTIQAVPVGRTARSARLTHNYVVLAHFPAVANAEAPQVMAARGAEENKYAAFGRLVEQMLQAWDDLRQSKQ